MPKPSENDPIRLAVLDTNWTKVQEDINSAMKKVKNALTGTKPMAKPLADRLKKSGRDQWYYAGIFSILNNLDDLLAWWDDKCSVWYTSGLLLDIGLKIGDLNPGYEVAMKKFNEVFGDTRRPDKTIVLESKFVKELIPGTEVQAGVSGSTTVLLQALRYVNSGIVNEKDKITPKEIEAIMNGLIFYWDTSSLKRFLNQFHTAVEVWAAYTLYLEEYEHKKPLSPPLTPPLIPQVPPIPKL